MDAPQESEEAFKTLTGEKYGHSNQTNGYYQRETLLRPRRGRIGSLEVRAHHPSRNQPGPHHISRLRPRKVFPPGMARRIPGEAHRCLEKSHQEVSRTRHDSRYHLQRAARVALGDEMVGIASNHRLRHSFASNALRSGIGLDVVRKLLRHANIATTMNIYAHLLDEDLAVDIEKMFRKP